MSTSSPYTDTGIATIQLTAAYSVYTRVTIVSTGKGTVSGIADVGSGVIISGGAADDYVAMRLHSCPGDRVGTCSEAIAVGDIVYTAAAGKYSKTSGGGAIAVGIAKTATTATDAYFTYSPTT